MTKWMAFGLVTVCLLGVGGFEAAAGPDSETTAPVATAARLDVSDEGSVGRLNASSLLEADAELGSECAVGGSPLFKVTTFQPSASAYPFCPIDGSICFDGALCRAQCRQCGIELGGCFLGICRCLDT